MERFDFGMYNGRWVDDIIASNPKYVQWCLKNNLFFYLSDEQHDRLKKELERVGKAEVERLNKWYGYDNSPYDDEDTEFDMDMKSCFDPNY